MTCEYQIRLEVENQEREIQVQPEAYNQASGGTISITENGTYDVTKYQQAEVEVPLPQGQIDINENGVHNVYDYATANVAVAPDPSLLFSTTIDTTGLWYDRDWVKGKFINWASPVIPTTFTIADTVESLSEMFSNTFIRELKLIGGSNVVSMSYLVGNSLGDYPLVKRVDLSEMDMTKVERMNQAFYRCQDLEEVIIGERETPNLTNIRWMMHSCFNALKSVDFSKWKAENLTDLGAVLTGCGELISADLSGWRTSKATDIGDIVMSCRKLKYLNLSGWTTESATDTSRMFWDCNSLEAVVIDSPSVFRITSSSISDFGAIGDGTGFVYVPDNLVDEYKSATNWSTVADQIKPLSELPQEVKDVFNMA